MKKSIYGLMALCLVFGLLLAGCPDPNTNTDLPIVTKLFEPVSGGFTQYYTNDSANYQSFTYILYPASGTTYEIHCNKLSGARGMEFGLMLSSASNSANNSYHILIDTMGWYTVEKRVGGNWFSPSLIEWTESEALNVGYDVLNKIKVTRSGSTYSIYLNDQYVDQFTDSSISVSHYGYTASVGYQTHLYNYNVESFPNTPVDIRFKRP
jgi:hypothetical protein